MFLVTIITIFVSLDDFYRSFFMKYKTLALVAVAAALCSCASNQQVLARSMGQAETSASIAKQTKLNNSATASAEKKMDVAKEYESNGEEEQAAVIADLSSLEYRLALLSAERDDVKKQNEKLEKNLREDQKRLAQYQMYLDKEMGGK